MQEKTWEDPGILGLSLSLWNADQDYPNFVSPAERKYFMEQVMIYLSNTSLGVLRNGYGFQISFSCYGMIMIIWCCVYCLEKVIIYFTNLSSDIKVRDYGSNLLISSSALRFTFKNTHASLGISGNSNCCGSWMMVASFV